MAGWIEHDPKPSRIAIGWLKRGLGASAPDDELDGGLEIIHQDLEEPSSSA